MFLFSVWEKNKAPSEHSIFVFIWVLSVTFRSGQSDFFIYSGGSWSPCCPSLEALSFISAKSRSWRLPLSPRRRLISPAIIWLLETNLMEGFRDESARFQTRAAGSPSALPCHFNIARLWSFEEQFQCNFSPSSYWNWLLVKSEKRRHIPSFQCSAVVCPWFHKIVACRFYQYLAVSWRSKCSATAKILLRTTLIPLLIPVKKGTCVVL